MDFNEDTFFNTIPQKSQSFFPDTNLTNEDNFQPQLEQVFNSEDSLSIYRLKNLPPPDQLSGSMNLLTLNGMDGAYNKFCVKKLKEPLSSYLSSVPSVMDEPSTNKNSSLQNLINCQVICTNEINPLDKATILSAFRLQPGQLPEKYIPDIAKVESKKKHKHRSRNRLDSMSSDSKMLDLKETKKGNKRKHDTDEKKKKKKEKRRKKEKERP